MTCSGFLKKCMIQSNLTNNIHDAMGLVLFESGPIFIKARNGYE